jgi:hypothetical protein
MSSSELDQESQRFLIRLFEQTNGDPSVQVSMYDVGAELDMDRDTSSRVTETLIGLQLVEIRTLSGGIGISIEGVAEVQDLIGDPAPLGGLLSKLPDHPVMEQINCQAVEQIASELKNQAGNLGLDFDDLTELMADLKTIDAQLGSPRPKTAIFRECLRSLKERLDKLEKCESLAKINGLLGE